MNDNTPNTTQDPRGQWKPMTEGMMRGESMTDMCPMASMCKGMKSRPGGGYLLMVPGAVLILGGILILIEPRILFWLMAGTSILIGVVLLVFANFIRKMASG